MSYAAKSVWPSEKICAVLSLSEYTPLACEDIMCSFPERESFLASLQDETAPAIGWEFIPQGLTRTTLLGALSILHENLYQGLTVKDGNILSGSPEKVSLAHALGQHVEFLPTQSGYLRIYTPESADLTENVEEMCSVEEIMFMQLVSGVAKLLGWHSDHRLASWKSEEGIFISARNAMHEYSGEYGGYAYWPGLGWEVTGAKGKPGWKRVFVPFKPRFNPLLVEPPEYA